MKRIAIPTLTLLCSLATTAAAAPRFAQPPPADPPVTAEPTRDEVRAALEARRALQIKRLIAYRDRGLFPRNRVSPDVINVFRDENGLLCAVANLIFLDGDLKLVAKTARDNNTVKMGTLKSGALYDWILASGFTQEEIAAIQLPDSPVTRGDFEWVIAENQRIVTHINAVAETLAKATEASLDTATDRIMAAGLGRAVLGYPRA